ncbi:hypothetical protein GCM10010468_60320 [Actinocorallia longicatena]|uniref:Uncharacterized protein n=1 Tax=Actinocorallia longicatena TaxID=111803 RepID=A0ABP6QGY9_9ACTN
MTPFARRWGAPFFLGITAPSARTLRALRTLRTRYDIPRPDCHHVSPACGVPSGGRMERAAHRTIVPGAGAPAGKGLDADCASGADPEAVT